MSYVMQKVDLVIEDDSTSDKDKLTFLYNSLPLKRIEEINIPKKEEQPKPQIIVIPRLNLDVIENGIDIPNCYK